MDWAKTEMQTAVSQLARQILTEADDPWAALSEAEILGVDLLERCSLLIEVGRAGARVPVFETVSLGAPANPTPGEVVTAALVEPGSRDPRHVSTVFRDGLRGTKICVPAADRASRIVIPAQDGVYVVDAADCQIEPQLGTNGDALGIVTLDGTPADKLGGPELLDTWLAEVQVGLCALHLGIAKAALKMTAAYTRERQQFGRPIGTFQAVQHRAADGWIDAQAMEVTMWQAAWRLSEGLPAEREVAIARYWACQGSHRVVAAAQHLHGGMGFDKDYPLHRYFLTAKHWEFLLGGASAQLETLGDLLASAEG